MADNATTQSWIEVPGEITLRRSIVPKLRVELPLAVHSHKLKCLIWAFALLFISSLTSFAALAGIIVLSDLHAPWNEWSFALFMSIILVPSAVVALGVFLTGAKDVFRRKPSLIIRQTGFTDLRCKISMDWSDISSGKLRYTRAGIAAVDLRLRQPTRTFQNPFRVGVAGFVFRQRSDRFQLPVGFLDRTPHLLAYAILTLIKRHGGEGIIKENASDFPLDITGPARL